MPRPIFRAAIAETKMQHSGESMKLGSARWPILQLRDENAFFGLESKKAAVVFSSDFIASLPVRMSVRKMSLRTVEDELNDVEVLDVISVFGPHHSRHLRWARLQTARARRQRLSLYGARVNGEAERDFARKNVDEVENAGCRAECGELESGELSARMFGHRAHSKNVDAAGE